MNSPRNQSMSIAEDPILGPPLVPLADDVTAAAIAYVKAHAKHADEVLDVLGLSA